MQPLKFSYNWNNKLHCKAFTTIRLSNRYKVGQRYEILLKGESKGTAEVLDIRTFKLSDINEFVARIDTGYSRKECIDILQRMYKNKGIDWNTQPINLVLLKYC